MAQNKLKQSELSEYPTWVKAVWVTAKGTPLNFNRRYYLIDVYADQHPDIVYMKSSQMGLSERMISEACWVADQLGFNILYAFPAQAQLADFVQARLNPVLMGSEYLKARVEPINEKKVEKLGLKRVGKGYIYFRGSQNEKQILSIDADMVILDERDRFVEDNVPFIEKRLLASVLKWRREVSTPTRPSIGVHSSYLISDMRIWQVKCKHCQKWQELDFFKHVDFEKKLCRCEDCNKPIDRLQNGRWYITNPNSKIHGYKINGLYNPQVEIEDIIRKYKEASEIGASALQQFYNQDLGLPYEITGQSIQASELDMCKRDFMFPRYDTIENYAGVDVGVKFLHVCVVTKLTDTLYRLIYAGTVENFLGPSGSVEQVLQRFKIKTMVIDKRPDVHKVKEMIDKFNGRVYAVDYPAIKFTVQEYCQWDDVNYELRLDRTISLDYLISDIQNQRIELPTNIETVEGFYDQLRSSYRVTEKNKKTGQDTARWEAKGADHYLHSLNYARMAQSRATIGGALLNYYKEPNQLGSPNFLDWLRINSKRI